MVRSIRPGSAVIAPQAETLRLFTALRLVRPTWAGSLLLGVGLAETGRSLALASLAAGAASLFLEADPMETRQAQRQGCCTFSVTTLEEAVRALKNEVRQGRAISVALSGDSAQWLAEMVERGVQPQAVAFARDPAAGEGSSAGLLMERGAQALRGLGLADVHRGVDVEGMLSAAAAGDWEIDVQAASTMAERRAADRELLAAAENLVEGGGPVAAAAVRWLRAAPSLFPRDLERACWVRTR